MKKILRETLCYSVVLFFSIAKTFAFTLPEDTTKVIDIEEVVIIASPKETSKLRQLPASVSLISQKDMQANRITSLKSASNIVPNFFMPDYGSRLTSAMYIRGIGSRINTPAVGMYVDNIPYLDKSAFDFNFYDIERLDILRGPQGTLYGRNTMGGLVKVHTRSPFSYQGTDVKLGYASGNNHRSASLTHYHRLNERFAFSAGGYYEGADGFFTNTHLDKKVDDMQAGGGRMRAIWLPTENWKLDLTVGYDYTDEGGYPYYYTGKLNGEEDRANLLGKIAYNRESSYRRSLLNTGLNIEHQAKNFIFNAVTGFQHLNDRMLMDQDFSPMDTYTIEQKQRINSITEEITFKSKPGKAWQWTTGVFGFYQNMNVISPVTFLEDGMGMLNQMLGSVIPGKIQVSMGQGMAMNILPSLVITDNQMPIDGHFKTPQYNVALFHQSQFRDLFGMEGLSFTAGLRLDYEKMQMTYNSGTSLGYNVGIKGQMTRGEQVIREIEMMPETPLTVESRYNGKLSKDYIQLLPKFALQYDFHQGKSNVYASVSKGHRSGGYNYQMFSELLQSSLKNDMMRQSKSEIMEKAGNYASMVGQYFPEAGENPDAQQAVEYKPEYTWSYELGTHLSLFDGKLQADLAAFYMQTYDQQLSRMADSGLGRITVNAGESESYGVEANLIANLNRHLQLNASYGYTHATFVKYNAGEDEDYSGNYVPFVPMHTLNVGGSYAFHFKDSWAKSLTLGANLTGTGKIYWTEANHVSQDFYTTLNGYVSLQTNAVTIDLWGRNLTDNEYTTFYFESMGRGFEQRCKPFQMGVDVKFHF
ncbi:MAG: TonB-dependent receptor [Bacteroidaceae bacterium]|nr:TonB-dependent receptor [Bacteroidaceae bacterium]